MPKEQKKRGRRAEAERKKRKEEKNFNSNVDNSEHLNYNKDLESSNNEEGTKSFYFDYGETKNTSSNGLEESNIDNDSEIKDQVYERDEFGNSYNDQQENINGKFYGLLNEEESEYFKQAESMLTLEGSFENSEERQNFVQSVFNEAKGKELKLATNQICSKLIERLIFFASDEELFGLFRAFLGNFYDLATHKYASHCCEALLLKSASIIDYEVKSKTTNEDNNTNNNESMEKLFLSMVDEIFSKVKLMVVQTYASHFLRILILILAGKPLPETNVKSSTLRSRKSQIARKMTNIRTTEEQDTAFSIPPSFLVKLDQFSEKIFAGLNSEGAKELCVNPIGSPVIQMLICLSPKSIQDNIITLIFGNLANEDKSADGFVNYLFTNDVGSHFFEAAINSCPIKFSIQIYDLFIRGKFNTLCKRSAGGFIIQSLLKRLPKKVQHNVIDEAIPLIADLANGHVLVLTSIVESSRSSSYKQRDLTRLILETYKCSLDDFKNFIPGVLEFISHVSHLDLNKKVTTDELQGALFLEAFISLSDTACNAVVESLLMLPENIIAEMAEHISFSHIIQKVLQSNITKIQTRKILNNLMNQMSHLACTPGGSHVVEACWQSLAGLVNYKERIAKSLFDVEEQLRETPYGRKVWHTWKMDLYLHNKPGWYGVIRSEKSESAPLIHPKLNEKGSNERGSRFSRNDGWNPERYSSKVGNTSESTDTTPSVVTAEIEEKVNKKRYRNKYEEEFSTLKKARRRQRT